jgi:hypothetical protein
VKAKLSLMLAVAVVIGGGIAHEALAGGDSKPQAATSTLTAAQKAARKRLAAQAAFLEKNNLKCGCQHHFPAPKPKP